MRNWPFPRRAVARWAVSIAVAVAFVAIGHALFGGIANLVTVPLALIGVTIRHDNQLGSCLPVVVLVLIVVAIMALLLFLVAVERGRAPSLPVRPPVNL